MSDLRMPDLNSVIIAGNLTNDPTFGETNDRTPVVNFHLASNRRFKDNKGQVKEDVCFVGVVAWDALARSCNGKLSQGSSVVVSGELQSRKWKSDDGNNRTIVEIKARKIQFLDKHKVDSKSDEKRDSTKSNGNVDSENNEEKISETGSDSQKSDENNMSSIEENNDNINENDEFGYKGLEI